MKAMKAREGLVHRIRLTQAARNDSSKQRVAKYRSLLGEYVAQNPVALAAAATLTLGGLLLLGFFLRIGFMPDVDLAGSMALIFAAALVGIGALVAFILATVLPGVGMRYLLDSVQVPLNSISVLTTAGPAVLLAAATVLSPLMLEPAQRPSSWMIIVACALVSVVANLVLLGRIRHHGSLFAWGGKLWTLILCSFLWILGLFQVLEAALRMGVDSPHPPVLTVFVLCFWLFFIGWINVAMAHLPLRVSLVVGPMARMCSVVVLAMLTSSFSTGSAATLRKLGIGEVPDTNLILTAEMCQALSAVPSALRCEPLDDKARVGVLKGVTIVSRIGSNLVVEGRPSEEDPTQPRPRLILRKDAVIAWTMHGAKGR